MQLKLFFIATLCLCGAEAVHKVPHLHILQAASISCSVVPVSYCTLEIGCDLTKDNKCVPSANPPPINCTELLASSGGAVAEAAKALQSNLKALGDVGYLTMKNNSKALDLLREANQKYDANVKKYNESLIEFASEEAVLTTFQEQLAALQATCSATEPPPPPTCPADIEKMEEKIAGQNTTCAIQWIKVAQDKQIIDLSAGLVDSVEKDVSDMMAKAAATYGEMQAMLMNFAQAKDDAMAYWSVVKDTCLGAPLSVHKPSWPVSKGMMKKFSRVA